MSQSSSSRRTLLPAPATGSTSGASSSAGGGSGPPDDKPESRHKRSQISVACEVCRRRKAKCDGLRPTCTPCQSRQLECRYGADPDATRVGTLKRKYQALTDRNFELEGLFGFLRDASTTEAEAALSRVRSGFGVASILDMARHSALPNEAVRDLSALDLTSVIELARIYPDIYPDLSQRHSMSSIRDRMNVNAILADPSIEESMERTVQPSFFTDPETFGRESSQRTKAQARKWVDYVDPSLQNADLTAWTKATDDKELLAHLVSMYLAWEAPSFHWFDKQWLVQDLINSSADSNFRMLFNALAAVGARISPRFERRNAIDDPHNMGTALRLESQRLLDSSHTPADLRTLQTIVLLLHALSLDGDSKAAEKLEQRLISVVQQFELFAEQSTDSGEAMGPHERMRRMTTWALYNYLTFKHFAAHTRPPFPEPPPFPIPLKSNPMDMPSDGLPEYPFPEAANDIHRELIFLAYSQFQTIQARITYAKLTPGSQIGVNTAAAIYAELLAWADYLPSVLRPMAIPSPHSLLLHMICHSMILDLFSPFSDINTLIAVDSKSPKTVRLSDLSSLSKQQLCQALEIYRFHFGFERGPIVLLQVFHITRVEARRNLQNHEDNQLFCSVIRATREISRSWYEERSVLEELRKSLGDDKDLLPEDVLKAMDFDEDEERVADDGAKSEADDVSTTSSRWRSMDRSFAAMPGGTANEMRATRGEGRSVKGKAGGGNDQANDADGEVDGTDGDVSSDE